MGMSFNFYILSWAIFSGIGVFVQYKMKKENGEQDNLLIVAE